jgi:hypothetical protein
MCDDANYFAKSMTYAEGVFEIAHEWNVSDDWAMKVCEKASDDWPEEEESL